MMKDKTEIFEDYGWKSKILSKDNVEITNILVPDNNIHNTIHGVVCVMIHKDIELTEETLVYLDDTLFEIISLDIDEDGDHVVDIKRTEKQ